MLDVTQFVGVAMLHVQHVSQHVQTLLSGLTLVDDDGVVQVTALDEVGLQQRLNVTYKDEGTRSSNLCSIVLHVVECCKLAADELRLKRTHGGNGELLVGQQGNA